ncbi:hypothetical protein [Senegalimassilia faecalis]|nr:hypothetical protein [Senegalimassilia faecalis]
MPFGGILGFAWALVCGKKDLPRMMLGVGARKRRQPMAAAFAFAESKD